MRSVLIALSLVSGLVVAAGDATAGATIDLLFIAKNGSPIAATNTVEAVPGDFLTLAVRFTNDVPLTGIAFSLNYDLDGDNELDIPFPAVQWTGVALNQARTVLFRPLGPLGPSASTFVGSFNGIVNNPGSTLTLPAGTYEIGSVVWLVNAVNSDGADIFSGFFNPGVDGLGGAGFSNITDQALFHSATVNVVPEPGTVAMLGLGLAGLIALGRRQVRQ